MFGACDRGSVVPGPEQTRGIEERLFLFAERHLPDEELAAAIPPDFDLDVIKRYGSERHRNPWITVGVRMNGPVSYARAIYYVHIEREDARQMYRRQSGASVSLRDRRDGPRIRKAADLDVPNGCALQYRAEMWVCHAWKAKVYLVVQATNDATGKRHVPLELTRAFAGVLERNLPARRN